MVPLTPEEIAKLQFTVTLTAEDADKITQALKSVPREQVDAMHAKIVEIVEARQQFNDTIAFVGEVAKVVAGIAKVAL